MSWRDSRKIIERIVVEGDLKLLTPTSLGNGESDGLTDMSLLLDEIEGKALLTGTSIAGALRNYLREYLFNFEVSEESKYKDSQGNRLKDAHGNKIPLPIVTKLFGSLEDDGSQSYFIIDDALAKISDEDKKLGNFKPKTELRDGVRIDGKTRTAVDKAKFDLELLETGTEFKLRFELLICEGQDRDALISAFATALRGFENGEIYIGARKRRGYGECEIKGWKVKIYQLTEKAGLLDWLQNNNKDLTVTPQTSIVSALQTSTITDSRSYFELVANFTIDGSILIGSGSKISDKYQPDSVHLRSNGKAIISGTSLAGALRHRAFKICNTLAGETKAQEIINEMFGVEMDSQPDDKWASRLEVREKPIDETKTNSLFQTRIKIDRFTGGAYEGALFDAAPVFSDGEKSAVTLGFRLRFKHDQDQTKKDAEIGLLLLLLKDLWTSDLAIGGESSIGRGRLKGISACLNYNGTDSWAACLSENSDEKKIIVTGKTHEFLNGFVRKLNENLKGAEQSDGG